MEQKLFIHKCKEKIGKAKYMFRSFLSIIHLYKEYCRNVWIELFPQLFYFFNKEEIKILNMCLIRFLNNYIQIYDSFKLKKKNKIIRQYNSLEETHMKSNLNNSYVNNENINVLETILSSVLKINKLIFIPYEIIFYCSKHFGMYEICRYILQAYLYNNLKKEKAMKNKDKKCIETSNYGNNKKKSNNGYEQKEEDIIINYVNNFKELVNYLMDINYYLNSYDNMYVLKKYYIKKCTSRKINIK